MMSFSSQKFANSASGSQLTPEDHFIQQCPIHKLADIVKLQKVESTFSHYIRETKGAQPPYKCSEEHETTNHVQRYRIDVQVCDGDTNTRFVFWDNSCIDLLGVTASDLQKTVLKDGVTNHLEYPETIDEMMGRTFAFHVKWQKQWKHGSVLECKDSKVLVNRIQKELNNGLPINSTETSSIRKLHAAESSESQQCEVQCSQSKPLQIVDTLDDCSNVSEVSASADFDPLQQTMLTPSKRSPVEPKDDDLLIAQQSSTRLIKKRSQKHQNCETLTLFITNLCSTNYLFESPC
ncbi:hypothetical protein TSUD_92850 [Trifolium subterraneum]|uniref:Replication factor A C-terminal domain-containing protein n=1 Tax=Trifolium subterraneum TaxID=3900 RepID=A0A2Z6NER1_TRISU|nr:hypothetical protein TSUD_92850 [Trifolium subterraneum]